ncbi:hypothetical protein ACFT0G_25245 [Streptomyces sp. NPDC057020]|uniref:hypothetical protein n=1 Tax=unclassified Streptomyces TaxID=2593676 RepID=UPI00363F2B88
MQNFDYDEAAAKLKCKPRFLQDRISGLPHQKLGESVAFCNCELAIIQGLFSRMPASLDQAMNERPTLKSAEDSAATLRTIRPAQGRKSRAVS